MSRVRGAQGECAARAVREAGIDPVCHTLVGAGLARSGLGRRTALGTLTLIVGANLPDIDAVAYFGSPATDLAFRRGWTHGVLALVLLPLLLTAAMVLAGRLARWVTRSALPAAATPRELLLLSGVSVLTHPILDTLNTYGVRWLMPFDGRWFYGDVLFIIDPWLWLALGLGVLLSLRLRRDAHGFGTGGVRPAQIALLAATLYAAAMALSGLAARRMVAAELERRYGIPVDRLLVSPHFFTPFPRTVVAAVGDRYVVGRFHWLRSPQLEPGPLRTYPRGRPDHPAVAAAAATPLGRRFLGWARFPSWRVEARDGGAYLVHIVDLRYAERTNVRFGSVAIPVTPAGPATGHASPDGPL